MTRLVRNSSITLLLALALGAAGCTRKPNSKVTPIPGYQPEIRTVQVPTETAVPADPLGSGQRRPLNQGNGFPDGTATRPVPIDQGNGGARPLNQGNDGRIVEPNALTPVDPLGSRDIFENMQMDRAAFQGNTVYFEYDRARIRSEERAKLAAVAEHLKSNSDDKLLIEGHCDERGTEEYNRALGERRALAAREYLASLGIKGDRVRTVSYGEDKPSVDGHDESAWSKNRRGEFILLKPLTNTQ
jgi:peptidoglycan-associated lipoprotein